MKKPTCEKWGAGKENGKRDIPRLFTVYIYT